MTAEVKRKTYSRDFKIEAVKLWQSGSQSAEETAKSLGISVQSLRMWKKELAAQGGYSFPGRGIVSSYVRELLGDYDMLQSISRKANCWDNAVAESFFHSLKAEITHNLQSKTETKNCMNGLAHFLIQ